MTYDPFTRGAFPVGVRTIELTDAGRSRSLPTEVWYPATAAFVGQDVAAATRDTYQLMPGFPTNYQQAVRGADACAGSFPLVIFSHGFGAHRRQSTFLCTHLASHGYLVASADHVGNTIVELMEMVQGTRSEMPRLYALFPSALRDRPLDARFLIDQLLDGAVPELRASIDASRIGITGHSFGGWTTLAVIGTEPRVKAALPLAPAGGKTQRRSIEDPFQRALALDWKRAVPTLLIAADRDTLLPLDGMRQLFARVPAPKRMVILESTDHMHFVDQAKQAHELYRMLPKDEGLMAVVDQMPPFDELMPAGKALLAVRGLGLAHFDAHLRAHPEAAALLEGDVAAALSKHGVRATAE